MKKTNRSVNIAEFNRRTCKYTYLIRKIYVDDNGVEYAKLNGIFCSLEHLASLKEQKSLNYYYEIHYND